MNKIFKYKIIKGLVLLIMLGAMPWSVSGQDGTGSDTEADEQMKGVTEAFLDWAAISFATYTGQHEAEMGSIFAKAKDGLEKYPELQELINDNTNGQGGMLAEGVNALTTKTGVKVYFLPQMANPDNKFYINSFNGFLAEGSANLIPPYILVKMDISGNNKAGYTVSCTVEASDDVKSNKYNLKSMDADNPFFGLNMTVPLRKNMASQMKLSLYNGVGALHDEMDGSLREDLSILHAGTLYRTGEELEVAYDEDKPTVLQVEDKDGQAPSKSVTWTLDPSDAEFETSGHQLTLAPQAGQWKVTATAGNKSTHVFLKSVDFNLDWKDIVKTLLYEALQTKLDQTKAKIDSLEAASPGFDSELQNQLQKIEAANYPLETNSNPLFSAYQEPQVLTGQDTVKFYSNATRAEGFKKLRKFKGHLVNVLQQVNMAAVIDVLVEDPKRFETLLNNMGDNISSLVLELIASGLNRTERDQKIKDIIFNYLNAHLVELADAEFASKHESYQVSAQAIPEPNSQIPALENENYYISPLVYFPGIEDFKAKLGANLAAMDDPPFVVINYSQDLSSEGYLNRAKAGKPKGIGDRPYKVYTLVNIPGSVKMNVFSLDRSDFLTIISEQILYSDVEYIEKVLQRIRCAYLSGQEQLTFTKSDPQSGITTKYGSVELTFRRDIVLTYKRKEIVISTREMSKGGSLSTCVLDYGGVVFTLEGTSEAVKENANALQDFIFPESEAEIEKEAKEVLSLLRDGNNSFTSEEIEAIRGVANCGAKYFTAEQKYWMIYHLAKKTFLWESYEDIILDLLENYDGRDYDSYAQKIVDLLAGDIWLLQRLFNDIGNDFWQNENNRERFMTQLYLLWRSTDWSESDKHGYKYVDAWYYPSGSVPPSISPFTVGYDKSLFLADFEYKTSFSDDMLTIQKTASIQGGTSYFKYKPFQPISLVGRTGDEDQLSITEPIPAIFYAGIIKINNAKNNLTKISLSVDVILTVTAVGNLAKVRHLSKLKSTARIVIAGLDLSTSAMDILLNYTDICDDPEFCTELKEYNFYLQLALLSEAGGSLLYKSKLTQSFENAKGAYSKQRASWISKGEKSEDIKLLDEHFGVANAGESFAKLSTKSSLNTSLFNQLDNALASAPSIKFKYAPNTSQSPKQFLNETGSEMFDLVLGNGGYAKFDKVTGRMLYSDGTNQYFIRYTNGNNVSNVEELLNTRVTQLRNCLGLNGSQTINLTQGLGTVTTKSNKVTTFIGKTDQTQLLKNQFGDFKHIEVGETTGSVNLLNMPDPYFNGATWFNDYNQDWVLRALNRGDDIYIASSLKNIDLSVDNILWSQAYGKSFYAQELEELIKFNNGTGYKPVNVSISEWNDIKTMINSLPD